ncbi:MAG TPA: hypothetical protein VMV79_08875 [Alphaproteobacteria bacterium]|nr:hypothetical protein [Alphaproteobacteria bacterium]
MIDAQNTRPAKTSLWKEGFRLFGRHQQGWAKLGLVFFVVMAVIDFLTPRLVPGQEIESAVKSHQSLPPGVVETMILVYGVMLVVAVVQGYLFNAFFLAREPVAGSARIGGDGFLSYLRTYICLILIGVAYALALAVLLAVGGGVALVAVKLAHIAVPKPAIAVVNAVLIAVAAAGMIYLVVMLMPAVALAANRIEHPIRNAWRLVRGNWWRVFGNMLLMMLLLMLAFLVLLVGAGLLVLVVSLVTKQPLLALFHMSWPVIQGAAQVIMGGLMVAFTCALSRILYEEKRRADPHFVLTTRG